MTIRPPRTLLALTAWGPEASSPRVRLHEWITRTGISCDVKSYLGLPSSNPRQMVRHPFALVHAELELRSLAARRHEVLFLLREASPLSRGRLEERLLRRADIGVYDFDDALQWDLAQSGGLYRRLAPKGPKIVAAVQAADRVIAGNRFLADWASELNQNVLVIPTCVDRRDYEQKTVYQLSDPPRIGWIGSPHNERHLLLIADALCQMHTLLGARLIVVSGPGETTLGPLEPMIKRIRWSRSGQRSIIRTFDIGIMPLPDSPYERGKCGYKLLQYAAAGVPSVGSPVGVNEDILTSFGMPAPTTMPEWTDALLQMLTLNAESRKQLALRAGRIVDNDYSYGAWRERWLDAVFNQT